MDYVIEILQICLYQITVYTINNWKHKRKQNYNFTEEKDIEIPRIALKETCYLQQSYLQIFFDLNITVRIKIYH